MQNLQARQIAQLNHLFGDTEGPRDQGLRSNDRGHGGQAYQWDQCPLRRHHIKRIFNGRRIAQEQGALTKIIQGECWHDHREPSDANGLFAEVAHVCVQSFAPRDAQNHSAQNDEGSARVLPHEHHGVMRTDRPQNFGLRGNVVKAQNSNGREPDQRDGTKKLANASRASFLDGKQTKQNDQGERDDGFFEGRRDHLQTFNGRQNRDGRCDDTVAIEQTGPKNAHHEQHFAQTGLVFDRLRSQRQHGHQTALTVVVGTQHQGDVLDRHNGREGPEKDGEDAVNVFGGERHMTGAKDLLHGIQNTGTNVAVHHTNGAQSQRGDRRFMRRHKKSAQQQVWAFVQSDGDSALVFETLPWRLGSKRQRCPEMLHRSN